MVTVTSVEPRTVDEVRAGQRLELIDALRGFALFGIFLVNLGGFALYGAFPREHVQAMPTAATDQGVDFLIVWLAYGKFNTIFSFLFGLGFSLLLLKERQRGIDFGRFYRRRLGVLLAIGLVHLTFIWSGDILALYALTGFILLLFGRVNDRPLLLWAAALLVSHLVVTTLTVLSEGALDPGAPVAKLGILFATRVFGFTQEDYIRVYTSSGWLEVLKGNLVGPLFRVSVFLSTSRFQRTLGMFLLGLWVGRQGILMDPVAHRALLRRVVVWGLPVGLIANAVVALVLISMPPPHSRLHIVETAAYVIGVAPLGLAYLAGLALLWLRPAWRVRLAFLAPAGRMALTCYLMQTFIGAGLFYGIGLGWAGKVGPTLWPLIAVAVFGIQVTFCMWWLKRFRFGPMEWVWRSLTYGSRQRMRNA